MGLLLAALAAISLSSRKDGLGTPVTYRATCLRAPLALAQLGKLANVELLTNRETENEVLVIDVKDRPLQEVMARIATVTSGEWKHEDSSYRLLPSKDNRRQKVLVDRLRKLQL